MATGFFHHIGTFLLFVSWVLLLVASISAPAINDLSLLRVTLTNGSHVTFGSFGACITTSGPDYCTSSQVGYKPADIMNNIEGTDFSRASRDTANDLTNVMILHPIAAFISFLAFLTALGAGVFGGIFASLLSFLSFIITVVALGCDFGWAAIIKHHVNSSSDDKSGSVAHYRECIWLVLIAAITSFIATFVVLLTCCSSRLHDRRSSRKTDEGYTTRRRRFW